MSVISKTILDNIDEEHIITYFNRNKIKRAENDQGMEMKYWIDQLFAQGIIDVDDFEKFLYKELFYGKRKFIRVYKLDALNDIKTVNVWLENLDEKFGLKTLDYINIMNTIPNPENYLKIAAVEAIENRRGQLERIKLLFVKYVQSREKGKVLDSSLYFPVEIDFKKQIMYIKTWNRINLESYKRNDLLDSIQERMENAFGVHIKEYHTEHKKVLYNMSQGLILDIYQRIPYYNDIEKLSDEIQTFENTVLSNINLKHVFNEGSKASISKEVIDVRDEIQKLLEKIVISDYFFDIDYEDVWNLGVDAIISKIRFKDLEHILTSLNGESSAVPIFCTKTFLALKKSLEDSEHVERIWVQKDRDNGKLSLTYDASCEQYLDIIILSNIRYTQEDLNDAMEMYECYGSGIVSRFERKNRKNVV